MREGLPARPVLLLLGIIKARAASPSHKIDHAVRLCFRHTVVDRVYNEVAIGLVARFRVDGLGLESQGERSLVIVYVAGEHNGYAARLEYVRHPAHPLVGEMRFGRIETRMVESDEP